MELITMALKTTKLLITSVASLFVLCGCNPPEKESNGGVTSVGLTLDNMGTYLSYFTTGVDGAPRENYSIAFEGVLNFALYDNVVVTLNLGLFYTNNSTTRNYQKELKLNAAGSGSSTLYYSDGKIDHEIDTETGYDNLMNYRITWSIKSISGSVKYRI